MRRSRLAVVACVAVLFSAAALRGDVIVRTDGTRLSGRIVAETKDAVTLETTSGGISLRQKIARANIRAVERPLREGPAYCAVPIVGVIGEDVTARDLEDGIREARKSKPRYIVLVIDSPGGAIDEMNRIVSTIAAHRDLEFVAFVKERAISAAAIIAMACPKIFMTAEAGIGACVPYGIGPDGTPRAVEEKWESAIRAQMRAAARLGGHDELWVRAMTELDAEVAAMPAADGKPMLVSGADAPAGARVVKKNGQILTVTGLEAAELGLAAGIVGGVDELKLALGHKAWHAGDDGAAWQLMEARARSARAAVRRQQEALEKQQARRQFLDAATPEIRRLDDQLSKALARVVAAKAELDSIKVTFETELKRLEAEREQAVRTSTSVQTSARANDSFRVRRHELAERYRPRVQDLSTRLREAAAEADILTERRRLLIAAAPAAE